MYNDLREFIEEARAAGELTQVDGADWDLEIGTITHLAGDKGNSPVLLFDHIKGYPAGYRVVTNQFTTTRRTALSLGLPVEGRGLDLVRALRDRIKHIPLVPPVEVDSGPVKENIITGDDVDLLMFPTPKWHEHDGGRYIGTGSVGVIRDPDEGWINLGTYRTQLHDKNTVTMSMVPGHRGESIRRKWWERGLACPVAIACGQEPTLWAASQWDGLQRGVSEYEFAGGLRGEPVVVTKGVFTDLPIPATAEIVLEGEILPMDVESRQEGPFGEWCGYYAGGVRTMPAVTDQSDPPSERSDPPGESSAPLSFDLVGGQTYSKSCISLERARSSGTGHQGCLGHGGGSTPQHHRGLDKTEPPGPCKAGRPSLCSIGRHQLSEPVCDRGRR